MTTTSVGVEVGQQAPDFTLKAPGGKQVSLSDYRGKKNVVLAFYPMDWSSVCSLQLPLLQENYPAFEDRDAVVLAISIDQIHSHAAFAKHLGVKYELLADFQPKGEVARSYGVYREPDGFSERATFIIDKQGMVRFKLVNQLKDMPDVNELLATLTSLAT